MLSPDSFERVQIAPAMLRTLCQFAAGDLNCSINDFPTDWELLLNHISRNGLLGITNYYLTHAPVQPNIPSDFKNAVMKAFSKIAFQHAAKYLSVYQVFSQLNQAKVDYLVIKGPAVAYTIYADPSARVFSDLDIVIRERDWKNVHCLLLTWGYEQEDGLPEPPPKLMDKAVIYEVKYVHQKSGFRAEVHFDDLLNSGLASQDIEGFWERAYELKIKGIPVKVLSLEDQLIHLCAHIHYHGYVRLNWFTDIAILVREHGNKLNWNRLIQSVQIEEAQVPVYYTFRYLGRLMNIHVPEWVMNAIKPDSFRCWMHEKYMPEEAVLAFRPMFRPDLSFYFIPLFKRMLPDLLIMGRRREKFIYLLHLLAPPKSWLRYYYHLDPHSIIEFHYLIHPFRLLGVYLRETFNGLWNREKKLL